MENLFILGPDGTQQFVCNMTQWRGVRAGMVEGVPYDVGAFSWPLPNSSRAAFLLDCTNSLYIATLGDLTPEDRVEIETASSRFIGNAGTDSEREHSIEMWCMLTWHN